MRTGERGEVLSKAVQARLASEVKAALRRRPASERKLAGALRALSPMSASVRNLQNEAAQVLLRRGSFDREIFASAVRSLAETGDRRAVTILTSALATEQAGGLATLSAACFSRDPALAPPLAKVAGSRHAHLAFASEVARMARGESNGTHLDTLAPKIKESHRIALCVELFVPLVRGSSLPAEVASALAVLRDSERHLGRWLVLAEVATRAGDRGPLDEARSRSINGPQSSRAAWSLVAWALCPDAALPQTRPTVELVARLSDRPSADRDTSFLFRLVAAKAQSARPMLEALAKRRPLEDDVAIRAAMHLVRDHGRQELRASIEEVAERTKHDDLSGVAAAALWDLGDKSAAVRVAEALTEAKSVSTMIWASLIVAANGGNLDMPFMLSEQNFRRVQWGWIE
jgi:hypothetical protein